MFSFPHSLFLNVKSEPSSPIVKLEDHSHQLCSSANETPCEFRCSFSTCPSTSKPWHPMASLNQDRHIKLDQRVYFHLRRLSQVHPQTEVTSSQGGECAMICRPVSHRWRQIRNVMRIGALPKILTKIGLRFHRGIKTQVFAVCIDIVLVSRCVGILHTPNRFIYRVCCAQRQRWKLKLIPPLPLEERKCIYRLPLTP